MGSNGLSWEKIKYINKARQQKKINDSKIRLTYYKLDDGTYKIYDGTYIKILDRMPLCGENKELKTIISINKLTRMIEKNEEELIKYHNNLTLWSNQIKNYKLNNKKINFSYIDKYTDVSAVYCFFLMFCKKYILEHDEIKQTESEWFENQMTCGLMKFDNKTNDYINCYSYDRNHYYQWCLGSENSDMYIPDKEGYEEILNELPESENLKFGIYRLKIITEDKRFYKVFAINPDNYYNYYDVKFAMKYKKMFNISTELIDDGMPNAYLYSSVVKSNSIFGDWYNVLMGIQNKFPKNKLIKMLSSMCWGVISRYNIEKITQKQYELNTEKYDNDYTIFKTTIFGEIGESNYQEYHYVLKNNQQIYKTNIRVKPFITSYSRCVIAEDVIKYGIDNIIRIHTDSITSLVPLNVDMILYKEEKKSSGLIKWSSCHVYHHKCESCGKDSMKYYLFEHHKCEL
jgi:hypothetical protein